MSVLNFNNHRINCNIDLIFKEGYFIIIIDYLDYFEIVLIFSFF